MAVPRFGLALPRARPCGNLYLDRKRERLRRGGRRGGRCLQRSLRTLRRNTPARLLRYVAAPFCKRSADFSVENKAVREQGNQIINDEKGCTYPSDWAPSLTQPQSTCYSFHMRQPNGLARCSSRAVYLNSRNNHDRSRSAVRCIRSARPTPSAEVPLTVPSRRPRSPRIASPPFPVACPTAYPTIRPSSSPRVT